MDAVIGIFAGGAPGTLIMSGPPRVKLTAGASAKTASMDEAGIPRLL